MDNTKNCCTGRLLSLYTQITNTYSSDNNKWRQESVAIYCYRSINSSIFFYLWNIRVIATNNLEIGVNIGKCILGNLNTLGDISNL